MNDKVRAAAEKMDKGVLSLSSVVGQGTLTVVVDFDVSHQKDVAQEIVQFWETKKYTETVKLVPMSEIIGNTDKDVIEGALVLYGTFEESDDSPVLSAFHGTWLECFLNDSSRFSTQVGVIAVGRHPFSDGYAVVFAATSLQLIPRLHECHLLYESYEEPESLILTVEGGLTSTMKYDVGFQTVIPVIDLDPALDDITFFFQVIEEAHPQPLLNISPEEYIKLKQDVKERLKECADQGKTVLISALTIELAKAAAALGDGHTSLKLGQQYVDISDGSRRMLPFEIAYESGDLYRGYPYRGKQRQKIVGINNQDPVTFLKPILAGISGEKLSHKLSVFVRNQGVYWYFLAPFEGETLLITTEEESGNKITNTYNLVSIFEHQTSVVSADEEDKFIDNHHGYYHEGATCYYRFDSFMNSDEQKAYADRLFAELDTNGTKNLVIDLRFNGGGNSRYGDYLLDYLTDKPYRMCARVDLKLSEHLYAQHGPTHEELTGLTTTQRVANEKPNDRGIRFSGDFYVLIGPSTYSSAHMFVSAIKDYELGTLIGEETGETRLSFGEVLSKSLPNSGLYMNVSCKQFFAPIPRFDDEHRGTVPDVPAGKEMFEKYPDSNDSVLSYALDYIASRQD